MSDSWQIATFRFEMISPLLDDEPDRSAKTAHYPRPHPASCSVAVFTRQKADRQKHAVSMAAKTTAKKAFWG